MIYSLSNYYPCFTHKQTKSLSPAMSLLVPEHLSPQPSLAPTTAPSPNCCHFVSPRCTSTHFAHIIQLSHLVLGATSQGKQTLSNAQAVVSSLLRQHASSLGHRKWSRVAKKITQGHECGHYRCHDGGGGPYTSKLLDISGRKLSTLIFPSIHVLFSSLVAKKIYKERLLEQCSLCY